MVMNINKIIPDSINSISRFYVVILLILGFDSSIQATSLVQFISNVVNTSPFYLSSATIIVLTWRLLLKVESSSNLLLILLFISPPIASLFVFYFINLDITPSVCGRIFIISFISYCFSYIEYFRKAAMTPIRNELLLESLKLKLKPHFLFNSINTVLGCIRDEPRMAERLLEDMSELFRSLASDDRVYYSLKEDLDIALKYIDIENIRMGLTINLVNQIDKSILDIEVPFLLLQPLVENSIRYGQVDSEGILRISARQKSNGLLLIVENGLSNRTCTAGAGTTQSNLKKRLSLMYEDMANISTYSNNGLYRVQIYLPSKH